MTTEQLGHQAMGPLFVKTTMPVAIGLLMAGAYNLVDGIFIARGLGSEAMGGVSMVLPIQLMIAALASLISTGMASMMTRMIGEKDYKASADTALMALLLGVLLSIAIAVLGLLYYQPMLEILAISPALQAYAGDYIMPILTCSFTAILLPILADIFRSEGRMQHMMQLIMGASVLNLLLDPLFIFVFDLGVAGAAWATIISQLVMLGAAVMIYQQQKPLSDLSKASGLNIRLSFLLVLGLPVFVAQMGLGVQSAMVNLQLQSFAVEMADSWVSAYGILGRIYAFVYLPLIAMMIAFQTICGFNLGAKNRLRVKQSVLVAFKYMTGYGLFMLLIIGFFPARWMSIFTTDIHLIQAGTEIVQTTIWTFPLAAIFMLATGFYQAKGAASEAIFFSALRIFFIMTPLLLILPLHYGFSAVLWSMPVADVIAAAITLALCGLRYGKYKQTEVRNVPVD